MVTLGAEFKFQNGQRLGKDTLTLKFSETPKCLRLNACNRRSVVRLHGNLTKSWIGKKVSLWADETVRFGGQEVGGIRIREK